VLAGVIFHNFPEELCVITTVRTVMEAVCQV